MSASIITPPHAYIPRITERHAEDYFDSIRSSVLLCLSADGLSRSIAFRAGLQYLDSEYYWEAHEVLEPVWIALREGSDERRLVQALIQLANAYLKQRMVRQKAAMRLCDITKELLQGINEPVVMGLAIEQLHHRVLGLAHSL